MNAMQVLRAVQKGGSTHCAARGDPCVVAAPRSPVGRALGNLPKNGRRGLASANLVVYNCSLLRDRSALARLPARGALIFSNLVVVNRDEDGIPILSCDLARTERGPKLESRLEIGERPA